MTKEKHNLYTIDEQYRAKNKEDIHVTKLFWFTVGFLLGTLITAIIILPYVN